MSDMDTTTEIPPVSNVVNGGAVSNILPSPKDSGDAGSNQQSLDSGGSNDSSNPPHSDFEISKHDNGNEENAKQISSEKSLKVENADEIMEDGASNRKNENTDIVTIGDGKEELVGEELSEVVSMDVDNENEKVAIKQPDDLDESKVELSDAKEVKDSDQNKILMDKNTADKLEVADQKEHSDFEKGTASPLPSPKDSGDAGSKPTDAASHNEEEEGGETRNKTNQQSLASGCNESLDRHSDSKISKHDNGNEENAKQVSCDKSLKVENADEIIVPMDVDNENEKVAIKQPDDMCVDESKVELSDAKEVKDSDQNKNLMDENTADKLEVADQKEHSDFEKASPKDTELVNSVPQNDSTTACLKDESILKSDVKSPENQSSGDEKTTPSQPETNHDGSCNIGSVVKSNADEKESEKYKCPKCSFVTEMKFAFDKHYCDEKEKLKEKEKDVGSSEEKKYQICIVHNKEAESFVCKACDFTNKGHAFEEHLMCHLILRPYQCLYCKECFINRREISRHVFKAHSGAKMSCALRALKRAKSIIKEVSNTGTSYFMARVQGKVPLERDPDKKRDTTAVDLDKKTEDQKTPDKESSEAVAKGVDSQQIAESAKISGDKTDCVEGMVDKERKGKTNSEEGNKSQGGSLLFNTSVTSGSFSKLREVLTSSTTPGIPTPSEGSSKKEISSPHNIGSATQKTSSDSSGIKILASYSLHEEDNTHTSPSSSSSSKETTSSKLMMEPNFIMACPSKSPENEPETLSFLGPERPIFKVGSPSQSILPAPSSLHQPPPQYSSTPIKPKTVKTSDFFICGFDCSFTCINKSSLLQHLKDIHSSNADFPCYYCGYRDVSEEALVNHIAYHADSHDKTKPLYSCAYDDCEFTSNMVTDFINHTKTTHYGDDDANIHNTPPTCKACGISFSDVPSLQTHLEENIIHIVNCPHCPSKATERRAILNHISSEHPGKPKMVSVAKQLICNARRQHGYFKSTTSRDGNNEMPPPTYPSTSTSVVDSILRKATNGTLMADGTNARFLPDVASEGSHSPRSESSGVSGVRVKEELDMDESADTGADNENSNYIVDENGVRRRIYVPMSERQAENFRCNFCTFVARDVKRLACHERSHGMPPTRKDRFKCMFCPQGFDSELKFRLHITCHPGLIKFLLYRCIKCDFDSNQKHTIVKHITCNRDKKHRGVGPVEDQYSIISRSLESRVLECEHCSYMTRHKIHMAIHYQREHGILRDKSDFRIEGLTPTDTPFSGHDTTRVPDIPMSNLHKNSSNSSTPDADFTQKRPYKKTKSGGESSTSSYEYGAMSINEINERNELFNRLVSQQTALQPGHVLENQSRKFKCPICKYLLPKAADLKNHVKRHSEVGQITLTMFRCKYCSCMSTARELLYEHLGEKHNGKPIALVKKTVFIDTADVDKSFAETAVEENLQQLEESVHNEIMSAINSNVSSTKNRTSPSPTPSPAVSFEQLFVIPEGGDTFPAALHCPKCSFNSHNRQEIIYHVTSTHPEVKVISSDEDVEKLAKATTKGLHRSKGDNSTKTDSNNKQHSSSLSPSSSSAAAAAASAWLDTIEEVLIVPDDQVFKEPSLCSRCDFNTILRKDMVAHLQQNHPEIAMMGRNSYPIQVSAIGGKGGHMPEPSDDSCVVGSGSLDNKLRCLYENYGNQMKCLICGVDRPKKFFIHVHILRHLNIFLWKCSYCVHKGLQKYKMVDHIKKVHPGKPMSVRYLRVNVESRVSEFLSQFNVLQNSQRFLDGEEEAPGININSNSNSRDNAGEDDYSGLGVGVGLGGAIISEDAQDASVSGLIGDREYLNDEDNLNDGEGAEEMSIQTSSGSVYVLGSDDLDEKIACLYQTTPTGTYGCLGCVNQFQKKFGIHRHIIISHLKVALLSCGYCGMQGVEKHQMVDHSMACHPNQPVSFSNNSVDIDKAVSGFLSDSCRVEKKPGLLSEPEKTELIELMKSWNKGHYRGFNPEGVKIKRQYSKKLSSAFGAPQSKKVSGSSYKPRTVVDPGVIMLGREALDKELNCLYQPRGGGHFRCLICRWEFPRKYPLHRHIMLKHLRMNLVGCPYCPYEGVEKYTVSAHIKEEHKDMPISIKYVQPDVGTRVRHFVEDMANGISTSQDLIKRPGDRGHSLDPASSPSSISSSASTLSALIKMKREKSFDDFGDDDMNINYNDDNDGEENDNSSSTGHGLVVAMFGKKSKSSKNNDDDEDDDGNQEDIVVKTEIEDDEFAEGSKLEEDDDAVDDNVNVYFGPSGGHGSQMEKNDDGDEEERVEDDEEEGGQTGPIYFEEEEMMESMEDGGMAFTGEEDPVEKEARMRAIRERFLKSQSYAGIKRPQAYAPGSYRSPNGGKPKALDVITKIKVLKAKDGPITKFCCEKCTFTSVHRSNVVRHIYKIHEKYQTHVCPVCNYQTLSLILMQTHMGKAHPGVEYTDESFNIQPPRSKPRSKPLMGPLSFQRRKAPKYSAHRPRSPTFSFNDGSSNDQIQIPDPSSSASTGSHTGPKQYACAYCHYETNTQADILSHTREKHTESYDASVNSSSRSSANNKKHNMDLENDMEFPDAGSIDDTATDACWERSKKAVKRRVSGPDTLASGMVRSKRKFVFEKGEDLIQCGYCDVRETSMGRMHHHFEWEHPDCEVKCKRIPSWRFVCKTCSVKTMATSKMKYHLNRHVSYRPYTCVNCGAFFPSPDQCRRHARSAGHEEQYSYIHNTKKEQRVEELLQATRQLALKIQEDAAMDPDFDIGQIDAFLSRYQDVNHNLKRVGVGSSPRAKKAKVSDADGDYKARLNRPPSRSTQSLGVEMDVTIQCYICKFESSTIHQTLQHHEEAHPGQKFLWTEMERGFTCDRSGEAILDSSSFPSTSEAVGYSTKMTLGSGSKTMRYKCKSCDFSSCVIQAMKSHLKSHQPKGFICAYCSRSFSGKEKLMRHQYCLHKGMPTWVIHLRKASATTLANTVLPEVVEKPVGNDASLDDQPRTPVRYVCHKCPFTSGNLLKYRHHLGIHKEFHRKTTSAEGGGDDSVKTDDQLQASVESGNESGDVLKNEDDNDGDNDGASAADGDDDSIASSSDAGDGESGFKCGHCDFSAMEKDEMESHHNSEHPEDEPITIDLKPNRKAASKGYTIGGKRKASDLVLDLEPMVKMQRISKSTLEAYNEDETRFLNSDADSEDGDGDEGGEHSEMFSDETLHEAELGNVERELDEEDEEEEEEEESGEVVEDGDNNTEMRFSHENISEGDDSNSNLQLEKNGSSTSHQPSLKVKFPSILKTKNRTLSNNEGEDNDDDHYDEGEDEEEEEGEMEDDEDDYHEGVSSPIAEDSEELARQLGLVENQQRMSSDLIGTDDSDMMIMEFNGMKSRGGSSGNSPNSSVKDGEAPKSLKLKDGAESVPRVGKKGDGNGNDEDDDDDDDDDEDYGDVNVSLGSPLPMISLGDGMDIDTI